MPNTINTDGTVNSGRGITPLNNVNNVDPRKAAIFQGVQEALDAIDAHPTFQRVEGLSLFVQDPDGSINEYKFQGGIADTDFKTTTTLSPLEALDEGNGIGYRLRGADPTDYGDIGENAVDFSRSGLPSTVKGATGFYSFAANLLTEASGFYSFASGNKSIASGTYSHAQGTSTEASGTGAFAIGSDTIASGSYASAEGSGTVASGPFSHAEGKNTIASGRGSHAEGDSTQANGDYSHAKGNDTIANADYCYVEGNNSVCNGIYSHVEGISNICESGTTHIEGLNNTANSSSNYSHMEGVGNTINPSECHVEGRNNLITRIAQYAHVEGRENIGDGMACHVQGMYNFGRTPGEHSGGRYGTDYSRNFTGVNRLVNYGNGTSISDRSDAYTLYDDGIFKCMGITVENLPSVAISGMTAHVTDLTSTSNGGPITGGGTETGSVFYDGTNWRVLAYSDEAGNLQAIDEGNGIGWRIKGRNPDNYGNIGTNAIDLSFQDPESEASYLGTAGAVGFESYAEGRDTIASGVTSHAEGFGTKATGAFSHAQNQSGIASGFASHVEGIANFSRGMGEHSGGVYGTDYSTNNISDRLVNYGNGQNVDNRSDAFTIFKNGAVKFFRATLSSITNTVKEGFLIFNSDDNNRPTIHNGTDWKGLAYTDELHKLQGYPFASLPSGEEGQIVYITDASNISYRGLAAGGGTDKAMVFFDGTNWIYH